MSLTATEKLQLIEQYVRDLYPVFRPAILKPDLLQQYDNGWDHAMCEVQGALLEILEADDADLG